MAMFTVATSSHLDHCTTTTDNLRQRQQRAMDDRGRPGRGSPVRRSRQCHPCATTSLPCWPPGTQLGGLRGEEINAAARSIGLRGTRTPTPGRTRPRPARRANHTCSPYGRYKNATLQIMAMPQVTLPVAGVALTSMPPSATTGSRVSEPGRPRRQADAWPSPRSGRSRKDRSRSSASCSASRRPPPSRANSTARSPPPRTSSAASGGKCLNTSRSSRPVQSSAGYPAPGRPGRPRSRPPGLA